MQFTHLKGTKLWKWKRLEPPPTNWVQCEDFSCIHRVSTIINSKTLSSSPKEILHPGPVIPHFPKPSSPRQLLIVSLNSRTCLFWRFRISGIIHSVASASGWLPSAECFPSSSVLWQVSALHSCLWLSDIPLCGWTTPCLSAGNTWVAFTFQLLGTALPWTRVHGYLFVPVITVSKGNIHSPLLGPGQTQSRLLHGHLTAYPSVFWRHSSLLIQTHGVSLGCRVLMGELEVGVRGITRA